MQRLFVSALLLLAIVLVGCAPSGAQEAPTATIPVRATSPSPTSLAGLKTQQIAFPGYDVRLVAGLDHGFAFTAWHGSPSREGLYYYTYSTQELIQLDSAAPSVIDGTPIHFSSMTGKGNQIVYLKSDDNYLYWEFDTVNVNTKHPTVILAPTSTTEMTTVPFNGQFATDGQRIVWSRTLATNDQQLTQLAVYDPQTGQSQQIATSTQNYLTGSIQGNTVIYMARAFASTDTTTDAFYRVLLPGGSPEVVTTGDLTGVINFDFDGNSLVWDDINTRTTNGLNLTSSTAFPQDRFACMRPVLSGAYLACVDLTKDVWLYALGSTDSVALAPNEAVTSVTFSPDRALWWSDSTHQVEYVLLPK